MFKKLDRSCRIVHWVCIAVAIVSMGVSASKVTIDADGGADYTSLDAVLVLIQANSIDPDTIEFIGSDQDTYSWTTYLDRSTVGTLVIRSTQTSPNSFTILEQSSTSRSWTLLQTTNIYFENLILPNGTNGDADQAWTNAQSSGKTLSFKRCVIKDHATDYFLKMEGGADNTVILENCLFEGNTNVFTFDYWSGTPTITIVNCTFDSNSDLFNFSANGLPATTTNISIKNCIFSNNTTTFASGGDDDILKGKVTYSLTSESTTGYGSSCTSNSNPSYVSSSRASPSDWMIQSGSPAQNIGTTSGAPATDISGFSRSSPDAGCWEYQANLSVYTWDNSTGAGYTAHSNTWSTSDAYWSLTGTSLVSWPGPANTARFAGSDGNWTVTVSGTQYVDSIGFENSGYKVSGGTALVISKKLSGTVFGFSPPYAAGSDSAKAFDGSLSTFCDDASSGTGYTGIDIGSGNAQRISYIRYYPRSSFTSRMTNGKFQGSNDLSSWSDLSLISSEPSLAWQTVTVTNTTAWRYLRYQGPANGYCNVAEVEFHGMGSIYVDTDNNDTIATALTGNSGIRVFGGSNNTSNLVLTGTNTYTGPTEVYSGRLNIATLANGGSNSSIGASSNSAASILLNGGVFRYVGGTQSSDRLFTVGLGGGFLYSSGSGPVSFTNTGAIAFSGSGARSLNLGGAHTGTTNVFAPVVGDGTGGATSLTMSAVSGTVWALTGNNTYTGTTNVAVGTLSIGNGGESGAISNSSAVTLTSTLTFNRSNSYTYSGVISGAGAIVKEGAGTTTLSGNLTHTGLTTVNAGTLRLTGTPTSNARKFVINAGGTISVIDRANLSPAPGSVTADWMTINGGTLSSGMATGENYGANRGFTLGASGGTFDVPYTDNTNPVLLYGVITGSGALTKTGTGAMALNAANTFTGGVTVNGGVLAATNGTALGNTANTITVNNGGSIDNYGTNLQGYTNAITINGQISSSIGALSNTGSDQLSAFRSIALGSNASIGNVGGRFDIGRGYGSSTCITGNGYTLTKVGSNFVAFLGIGTGLGGVVVNGGTLQLERADAVGTAPVTLNTGGVLTFYGSFTFTNALTLAGGTLQSGPLNSHNLIWSGNVAVASASTVNCGANNTTTLSGAITGAGSIAVTGSEGYVVLSGNSNTYSGGTTVSGGTLRITNASGSATGTGTVTVSSAGTLDGTGSVSGAMNVSGTLSPGIGGIGRLTVGSNLTFNSGATFSVQANSTTPGSGYDQALMSTGTLALGSATLAFSLGYAPTINDAFTIIDNAGSNLVSGTFSGLAQGATTVASYNGVPYDCVISYIGGTGNDVVLTVTRISAEDYANEWGYSQSILLNTTATGSNVSGNVLNFPVLLRLNPANFDGFSQTQPGGVDIRFAKTNGAKLSYEIESWKDYDNDADTAVIWVKVDTVYGNNKSQSFVMYWGKSNAADSSDGRAVFATANGFAGVWHLNTSGTTSRPDATSMNNSAHPINGAAYTSGGAIAGCDSFVRASSQYDSIASGAINLADKSFTIMAWVKMANAAPGVSNMFVGQGPNATRQGLHMGYRYSTTKFTVALYSDDLDQASNYTGGTNWQLVSATFNTTDKALKLYMNGKLDNSKTAGGNYTGTGVFRIGNSYNGTGDYFDGTIDEVVVSEAVRDSNWIKLCYENQKSSQTLVSFEDYSTWGFSRNIIINTSSSAGGANITSNCIGFPLLVRLTSTTFDFNQARDSGQDIRFSKSNGQKLAYEIERWNKAGSLAEVWVRVDTVYHSNSTQYIKMYWGKNGVASRSSGNMVFDTSNGFQAVWHFGESSGNANDATVNGYHASRSGNVAQTAGGIGYGQTFDGTDDYFTVASLPKVAFGTVFTASSWLYIPNSVTSAGALWSQSDGDATWEAQETQAFFGDKTTNSAQQGRYPQFVGSSRGWMNPTNALGTDGWHYVTYVYQLSDVTRKVYINATSEVLTTSNYAGGTDPGTTFIIGNKLSTDVNNDFNGKMDELRLSNVVRSADWVKLCYETQKTTPTLFATDSADAFRPLGIRRYGSSSAPDSIYIGTNRWALRFAKNSGGGIKFLAADSTPANNQLDANLFYLLYNGVHTSDTGTGTITLIDSSIVFSRVRQQKTVGGQPFTLDYTVLGSGKMFVRVYATAASALSGGLEFRIANKNVAVDYRNIAFGSAASSCSGVAHIDSTAGRFDVIMAPYDVWSDANQITTDTKYTGIKSTGWSAGAGSLHTWEFMVDFGHSTLKDSAAAYRYVADYRNSDTMGFYAGTPILEQAWESEEKGEWAFNEGTGSTSADKSGRGHTATISGTPNWTVGKWNSNALQLGGGDSITVAHSTDFGVAIKTIMAWIKPSTELTSSMSIVKKYSSSNVGFNFSGSTDGKVQFSMANGGASATLQSTTSLTPGVWHHVAVRMFFLADQDFVLLTINGKPDTVLAMQLDSYLGTTTDALVIGKEFNGVVEDVRYYNKNLTDQEIRAIALKGFSPDKGLYSVRADNNSTLHVQMHGSRSARFLPVLQIQNWWATTLPSYVYIDGVGLTSGSDYYAALDDNRNQLTIGFNRVVNGNQNIYIDDNYQHGNKGTGATKKMYWGIQGASNEYFWVKNTAGRYFGAASANEFYLNWKMNTASIKDGEIWQMRSSVTNPYTLIDTAAGTNLIPGDDGYFVGFGGANAIDVSTTPLRITRNVTNTFSYAVEESSQVRVRLRVNERQVVSGQSYRIVTRWTLYPTGQMFRYDSIYTFSADPTKVFVNMFMDDSTYSSVTIKKYQMRGINIYSQKYPDFTAAWLSMRNNSATKPYPFSIDTVGSSRDQNRSGFEFCQYTSVPTNWTSALSPIQTCVYIDFRHANMNTASMDSVANGVQCSRIAGRRALTMITGTLDSTTNGDFSDGILAGGDLNGDGFNEMEGAYILGATNNTVRFVLPAYKDTCRFYPAFRITNYTAVNRPQYVYVYKIGGSAASDTLALLEGYQFNSYVHQTRDELIIQIDSIFCDSVGIYISSDKTLAVKMSSFEARSGNRSDTLLWRTESEHENLGYRIERRINPEFFDSMMTAYRLRDTVKVLSDSLSGITGLIKRRKVQYSDTQWVSVNKRLIPGAPSGTSHGPRDYQYVDGGVYNDLQYDYKLVAVDFKQSEDVHGPVSVVPRHIAPAKFMLGLNYPNPFRTTTRIRFALPEESAVSLSVYTLQGRLVRTLVKPDRVLSADYHTVLWDGKNSSGNRVAAGQYIYRMSTKQYVRSKMMLCIP